MQRCSIFFLLLLFVTGAAAEECTTCASSLAPRLWIPGGDPALDRLPLKASRAAIRINGPIAEVTVTQQYRNTGQRALNARYVFPGSTRAAVHGLTMQIGERRVHAKIKEKAEATRIFAKAQKAGKRAALLEQQRPNVFTMAVANIMPGDEVTLTLRYSELLIPEQGVYELVYPQVVGPRYGNDPLATEAQSKWLANPYAADDNENGNPAAIKTAIEVEVTTPLPLKELYSVQHKIETQWQSSSAAAIHLDGAEVNPGNRDFILRFRLADDRIAAGLMTFRKNGENYFLMMAEPPARPAPEQVMAREYLFVVDVSGSMHGFPLDTARHLLGELLSGLHAGESFNILFFSGGSRVLAPAPLPATAANVQQAMAMMRAIQGGGGTELLPALERAFAMPRTADQARSVIVITDGYISAERGAYDLIRSHLNRDNLFAFGIGSAVNRYLIEALAHAGAGEPFIVTSAGEANEVAARFRRYIASPLLSDVAVAGSGVELYDLEPAAIPLMMAERPIVVFGKYRGGRTNGAIEITGRSAAGDYRAALPLTSADNGEQSGLLPVLWARHRLRRLSDMQGSEVEAARDEIVKLGLEYSLLSRYTSFVAVDEIVVNPGGRAARVNQPLPLPHGVSELAVSARPMPEPEFFWLVLGLLLIAGRQVMTQSQGLRRQ